MQQKIRRRRYRGPLISPYVFVFIFLLLVSILLALFWQKADEKNIVKQETVTFDDRVLNPPKKEVKIPEVKKVEKVEEKKVHDFSKPVEKRSSRVNNKFFSDAVFIGDSITTGIELYDVMDNATVYASTGISLSNVLTKEIAEVNGELMTIPEALQANPPGKVYLLLGANSLGLAPEKVLEIYANTLDTLQSAANYSDFYVMSVFPINEELYSKNYKYNVTNEKIQEFNHMLLKLCEDRKVYFLDLYSFFADENGQMPKSYTSDGLHIYSNQYMEWFDYLKNHTVDK